MSARLLVRCAKCARPAEHVDLVDDPQHHCHRLAIRCHGEADELVLPYGEPMRWAAFAPEAGAAPVSDPGPKAA